MRRRRASAGQVPKDWRLRGHISTGEPVSLTIDDTRLWDAHHGLTIGRHPQLCDFILADPTISRRHFRLVRTADGVMIEDLNSLNGTYLNGWRLEPFQLVRLRAGLTLTVGHVALSIAREAQT